MTTEEIIEYWEQFSAEIDDLYNTCSDAERSILEKQREVVEFTISALRGLHKAEKDGRLVVLPCKVGDTVYRVIRAKNGSGHVAAANVSGLHLGDTTRNCRYRKEYEYVVLKVDGGFCAHVNKKDFGKTVFLTREEAEAALKGGEINA